MGPSGSRWLIGDFSVYLGEYSTTLDDKGRITVPRHIRVTMEANGDYVWYLTRGFDNCVFLYNQEEWKKLREQMNKYSSMNVKALKLKRILFGGVAEARPDGQGRMSVPSHLRDYAGIDKDAVLIGLDDHLELWSRERWHAFQETMDSEYKELAAMLFDETSEPAAAAVEGEA